MSWQIRISTAATRDMGQALEWTLAKFGPRKHAEYLGLIRDALAAIGEDPKNKRSQTRSELHRDARTYHIAQRRKKARHFFVYRIRRDGAIDVARFLYDGMELARHLTDDLKPARGNES